MRLSRLFQPQTIVLSIATFLVGVLADFITNTLLGGGTAVLFIVVSLTVIFGLVGVWLSSRAQSPRVTIEPIRLDNPASRLIHAHRGLIAFVSLYHPGQHCPLLEEPPERWLAAAEALDYETLALENSNLATLIATISAHASKLEHCWLLATNTGDPATSSTTYLPVLKAYLQNEKGLRLTYHHGPEHIIRIDRDDALITNQTRSLINNIYQDAQRLSLPEEAVVADFSGGYRSMMLGMILACLNRGRDIQFAGTRYDANAKPTGEIFPILFNFEAELEQRT